MNCEQTQPGMTSTRSVGPERNRPVGMVFTQYCQAKGVFAAQTYWGAWTMGVRLIKIRVIQDKKQRIKKIKNKK
jgi:hypothetical protein